MGCRKHSPGTPCCPTPDCCLDDADYVAWQDFPGYEPGSCCRICEFDLVDDPWTIVCSDPIRTDTRYADAEYKYYTTPFPEYTGTLPSPWPECPNTPKTLCATITETHEIEVIERLVMRWKRLSQSSSIAKLEIECDGDTGRVCRWVVSSQVCLRVEYGQFEFRSEDHVVTGTGSDCCSIASALRDIHDAAPTCEYVANAGLPSAVTICIKRVKIFSTMPTGEITFSDGDWVDCEDLGLCIRSGVESFSISSTDFGEPPWTAPECISFSDSLLCIARHYYTAPTCCDTDPGFADGLFIGQTQLSTCTDASGDCDCEYTWDGDHWIPTSTTCDYTPATLCNWYNTGQFATITKATINVLGRSLLNVPLVTYAGCTTLCDGTNTQTGFISEVTCTLLSTPYHPAATYTSRTLSIVLAPWTVDLGACP